LDDKKLFVLAALRGAINTQVPMPGED